MNIRYILCVFLCFLPLTLFAAVGKLHLYDADVDLSDTRSLQQGARIFVNYCMGCHSAKFMRYNRMGADLGISDEILKANFMFGTDKTGDLMTVAMSDKDAKQMFGGVIPPDLSVIARYRGADWLTTYFMTFYSDPLRPMGVNNLMFKDTAMPHILMDLQGLQKPVFKTDSNGNETNEIDRLELVTAGIQTEEEYKETVRNLVNFLVYLGEPIKLKRQQIGIYVLVFLFFLLGVVYLLKQEYWKDVH
jgi:ubiquinol-cytochrome c reductase cytochrome c1 subunit